eukprot:gene22521-30783_t
MVLQEPSTYNPNLYVLVDSIHLVCTIVDVLNLSEEKMTAQNRGSWWDNSKLAALGLLSWIFYQTQWNLIRSCQTSNAIDPIKVQDEVLYLPSGPITLATLSRYQGPHSNHPGSLLIRHPTTQPSQQRTSHSQRSLPSSQPSLQALTQPIVFSCQPSEKSKRYSGAVQPAC